MGQATETLEPRVYVACLAAYNAGRLHGAWIAVDEDAEALCAAVAAMLTASPEPGAEEWAIHDHEGFGGVEVGEFTSLDRVAAIAGLVRARGRLGALVLEHLGGDLDVAVVALEEQYLGQYASLADCFQERTEETVDIPEPLRLYIDYEAMARDAVAGGEVFTLETAHDEVHVFWAR